MEPETSHSPNAVDPAAAPLMPLVACIITGVAMGIVFTAVVMAAYLLAPFVLAPWTFVIAGVLLAVVVLVLAQIPHKETTSWSVIEPQAALIEDREAKFREEKFAGVEELRKTAEQLEEELTKIPRATRPAKWSQSMDQLGQTYLTLSKEEYALIGRRSDMGLLRQASACFRRALKERSREKTPQEWALTSAGMGATLLTMGDRTGHPSYLEDSVTVYTGAVEVLDANAYPDEAAAAKEGLAAATQLLEEFKAEDTADDVMMI